MIASHYSDIFKKMMFTGAASIREAGEAAERQVRRFLWQPYKRMKKGALSRGEGRNGKDLEKKSWLDGHNDTYLQVATSYRMDCTALGRLIKSGCLHEAIVTGGGSACVAIEAFTWVNTMIGNIKNSMHDSYHAISDRYLPRYLAEFCYQFNRRFNLEGMITRLGYAAVRTLPMPQRLLSMAEAWG